MSTGVNSTKNKLLKMIFMPFKVFFSYQKFFYTLLTLIDINDIILSKQIKFIIREEYFSEF